MIGTLITGCGNGGKTVSTSGEVKTLAAYEGIEVYESVAAVTDSAIEEQLKYAAEQNSTSENVTKGKVADGDVVNIDYAGKIDGEAFDGGTATGADLTIGSGSFIDDFEEQLIGLKIGDSKTIEVTFPDPYERNTDLSGKDATFDVTINHKVVTTVPEVTDAFVVEYFGYTGATTVDEFKEYIKERIKFNQIVNSIWESYLADCEVTSYPEDEVAEMESQLSSYYEYNLYSTYGVDLATYLSAVGQSEEEWNETITTNAKTTVKEKMVINAIAKEKGWTVSEEEYQEQAVIYATQQTYDSVADLETAYGRAEIEYSILSNRVLEYIAANVTVVPDPEEATTAETTTAADETTTETE